MLMNNSVLYKIEGITKKFPGVAALDDVSFDIREGEVHAVVGENGAGKSTLMNILSGGYVQTSGKTYFQGKEVVFHCPKDAQNQGIAMIHQELSLAHTLSIAENIFQGRLPKRKNGLIDNKKLFKDTEKILHEVGLGNISPDTLVKDINVSQQQQVEIAKALSLNAKFLILDEPTSALTPKEANILLEIMKKLKNMGITMLYISHKLDEIMRISDRITVLRDGKYIDTLIAKETKIETMISKMVGREYTGTYERKNYLSTEDYLGREVLLEVTGLHVKNKVEDVSFKLYKGEVLGITGLVGAGRSEVLQAVFGADKRISGKIEVNGKEVAMKCCKDAIKNGMGLVPEGRKTQSLFMQFDVGKNMTIVYLKKILWGLGFVKKKKEGKVALNYKELLRVKTPSLEQKISHLSGGNQQKAVIARWLMNNPQILFLDEPTQGIDIGAKNEIYDIIDSLAENGVGVVVVSSEMQETIGLCDRVLVMYEGKITGEVSHDNVTQETLMTLMSGKSE